MHSYPKFILACLIYSITTTITAQISDCPYDRLLTDTLSNNSIYNVEHNILSSQYIDSPSTVIYDVGNEVFLNNGFGVNSGASISAIIAGCEAKCDIAKNLCESTCTSPLIDDMTPKGQRFVKHEIVLTFPDELDNITVLNCNTGSNFGNCLVINGVTYNIADTMSKYFPKIDPGDPTEGELSRCLCDRNIFLYENYNLIFEEGGIAQRNKSGVGPAAEGGVFSLNYILEHLEPHIPDSVIQQIEDFKIYGQTQPDPDVIMVAILDSGLEPQHMPINSLYYDPNSFTCPMMNDMAGWNFVDDNNDLTDRRGHGTLVTLSYFNAYEKLSSNLDITKQQVLTVKVLNDCGEGTTYSTICGMRYAEKKGAKMINMSWGMYQNDRQLQRTVEELDKIGIFMFASAGNQANDLNEKPHFPSGYAADFDYIVQEDSIVAHIGFDQMYEVGGACRFISAPCVEQQENTPLAASSNYRDFMFVEASKGIEALLPVVNRPSCTIEGTSYAAPQLMAGGLHSLITNGALSKQFLKEKSKKIHPEKEHYSYRMANCN